MSKPKLRVVKLSGDTYDVVAEPQILDISMDKLLKALVGGTVKS